MHKDKVHIAEKDFKLVRLDSLVIGSGAAGLNAAIQLHNRGIEKLAIITEKWGGGTSNNAGSDKQTYYRLAADGPEGDQVTDMAAALFKGGAMHGDIALIEATLSSQAFYHLVSAGVPFPHDEFGRYPGFITDHDPKGRGTSAGPLTSRFMFEALAAKVVEANIPILDEYLVVKLLTRDESDGLCKSLIGAIALKIQKGNLSPEYLLIQCPNILLATGGPGGLYEASVYPQSQHGALGLAIDAGAKLCNLTESQFGIASIKFRWNLSGSYQQVIPRYFSIDESGAEYEFLTDYFDNDQELIQAIFLKGYQWPFDVNKIENHGSSVIDLLVYVERYVKKRAVFIDFRSNPRSVTQGAFELNAGGQLVMDYLEQSGALGALPIDRLEQMNYPAFEWYKRNGINLQKEALEIDVCAQHCNGGVAGSIWWESNIKGLFPVGEANGGHGVYRPGGSALNAGQVGGFRAAQFIAAGLKKLDKLSHFIEDCEPGLSDFFSLGRCEVETMNLAAIHAETAGLRKRMSQYAGFIRTRNGIEQAYLEALEQYERIEKLTIPKEVDLAIAFHRLHEQSLSQLCFLGSIQEYLRMGGESRGAALVAHQEGSQRVPGLDHLFYQLDPGNGFTRLNQLQVWMENGLLQTHWEAVRQIPTEHEWFEALWKKYRNKKIIR